MSLPVVTSHYCKVANSSEMIEALNFAKQQRLAFCILGGGSNVIFQGDFAGLVLHIQPEKQGVENNIRVISEDEQSISLEVAAGVNWDAFLQYCLAKGFYGLENLAIIPGTVGAAPIQNIGAYGQEVSNCITEVEAVEVESLTVKRFSKQQCQFAYRDSLFKRAGLKAYVLSSVSFRLSKSFTPNLSYQVLANALFEAEAEKEAEEKPNAQAVREAVITIRQSKLPNPDEIPNTGSFFKNPVVASDVLQTLQQRFKQVPHYPQENGTVKLAAGWLIEQAGFKGKQQGPVAMYEKQALVLVNNQGGSSADVLALAESVKKQVKAQFGVTLEQEPVLI